jgi:hypothetical protein
MADEQTENSSSEEKTEENVNYAALLDSAEAKIATLEEALEAKQAENLALKAANYDLLMQVGVESNEDSLDEEEEQLTIDDLF